MRGWGSGNGKGEARRVQEKYLRPFHRSGMQSYTCHQLVFPDHITSPLPMPQLLHL